MASADQPNSQETNNNNVIIITRMDSKLFKAAINGEIQVFKNQLQLEQLLTPEKNTVVHVNIIATKTSTHNNTTTFLEGILEMCPQLLLQTNARGESPLHLAARYGHDLIVEFLINRAKLLEPSDLEKAILGGVDSSEVVQHMMRLRNKELDTALHEAVRFNHLKVVRILTREDPHFTYLANEADETPLYMAVGAEYLDLVDEILNNCSSPSITGPNGRNVLHAATLTQNPAIFALGFMVIAFVTGTYAVLSLSNALAITICECDSFGEIFRCFVDGLYLDIQVMFQVWEWFRKLYILGQSVDQNVEWPPDLSPISADFSDLSISKAGYGFRCVEFWRHGMFLV
ncbi:uncharacterized protein LOC133032780 [Cannabis sativa]|uniref:uncharacterized protein LOC133032780 n=1 Tax=Cannabis sativa TaxID=3483 RepID=UPI0029CA0BDA|nr:uncharacterized protein LOC133032780 [Cannabis sativa]